MSRKSGYRFSEKGHAQTKKVEQDDDSKKSHPGLCLAYDEAQQARQSFSAVAGMSRCAPAPPGMASATAFMSAAIAAVVPASPAPFTPMGFVLAGTRCNSSLNSGMSSARGMA